MATMVANLESEEIYKSRQAKLLMSQRHERVYIGVGWLTTTAVGSICAAATATSATAAAAVKAAAVANTLKIVCCFRLVVISEAPPNGLKTNYRLVQKIRSPISAQLDQNQALYKFINLSGSIVADRLCALCNNNTINNKVA